MAIKIFSVPVIEAGSCQVCVGHEPGSTAYVNVFKLETLTNIQEFRLCKKHTAELKQLLKKYKSK
jgi:hypothetical protein